MVKITVGIERIDNSLWSCGHGKPETAADQYKEMRG